MATLIRYLPHTTRAPVQNRKGTESHPHQRAYDFSWWNRGVGKTMRRAWRCWEDSLWFPNHRVRHLRRAHALWRRAHRVRRAQWATQTYSLNCSTEWFYMPLLKYVLMGFHWLMQKHHERAFASLQRQ